MTHICVGNLAIIGSDNGFSPGRRQAIIWTNDGILLIGPLGTNFSEIWIWIETFSLKKMHFVCEVASILSRPQCVNVNSIAKALELILFCVDPLTCGCLCGIAYPYIEWDMLLFFLFQEFTLPVALLLRRVEIIQGHQVMAKLVQSATESRELQLIGAKWRIYASAN